MSSLLVAIFVFLRLFGFTAPLGPEKEGDKLPESSCYCAEFAHIDEGFIRWLQRPLQKALAILSL
jgi:hypothetical protein